MKVIITSDTHYLPQWQQALETSIAEIAALRPDCLIVAGDVGERLDGYRHMLALLKAVDCPRLILSGNHDLWQRDGIPSAQLWAETLPQLTRESGAIWLETENWIQDGLGICGTNGWYDYTGRDPSIEMTLDEYFRDKHKYMADGNYIDWQWTDIEFADLIGDAFSTRLAALDADPTIREILVATHVPAFAEAIERKPNNAGNLGWNRGNAYFYNLTLGQRILTNHKRILPNRKVTRVVSGHTHIGKHAQIPSASGLIDMHVLSADYGHPAYLVFDYN